MLLLLGLVWYYVSQPSDWGKSVLITPDSAKGEELWAWVQSLDETDPPYNGGQPKPVDWAARREKVRDTFVVSWDGYEKYAWGTLRRFAGRACKSALLIRPSPG